MFNSSRFVFFSILVASIAATDYKTPPDVLNPSKYTTWLRTNAKSKMGFIDIPFVNENGENDNVHMYRLDMVGDNDFDRGFAHGALMRKEIVEFVEIALPEYYLELIFSIDISKLPEPIQKLVKVVQVKTATHAEEIMNKAMRWVFEQEYEYMPKNILDEMSGVAHGMCSTIPDRNACNVTKWEETIQTVNMLPELIKMACTAFGAWGPASTSGNLIQNRALDFGFGPFGNYTVIAVYRTEDNSQAAFMSVSFPGFVGVVTGVSENVGITEKFGDDHPGAYDGEPDVFVLRDILQSSQTKEQAEEHMVAVKRTWAMYVGVGDYVSQKMDIVMYQQASAIPYTDVTMPTVTSQPYLESVVYVDKHSQPSNYDPNDSDELYTALSDFYGDISLDTARTIIMYHRSGDVHIQQVDFGSGAVQVAIGRVNAHGRYGDDDTMWKAYNRPFVRFNMKDLWTGNA